jgi:hypothetical protein
MARGGSPDIRKQYEMLARQWRHMAEQVDWMERQGIGFSELKPK